MPRSRVARSCVRPSASIASSEIKSTIVDKSEIRAGLTRNVLSLNFSAYIQYDCAGGGAETIAKLWHCKDRQSGHPGFRVQLRGAASCPVKLRSVFLQMLDAQPGFPPR